MIEDHPINRNINRAASEKYRQDCDPSSLKSNGFTDIMHQLDNNVDEITSMTGIIIFLLQSQDVICDLVTSLSIFQGTVIIVLS